MADFSEEKFMAVLRGGFVQRILVADFGEDFVWWFCMADLGGGFR